MLMEGKALTEGLRALCLWAALQVDLEHAAPSEEERELAADLVGLLTPVIKGVGTDIGYRVATDSQQVYGGHGYIAEWGMEQYVRDARIAMLYEGTNGVQAMDLVGRKLPSKGGAAIQAFFAMVAEDVAAAGDGPQAKMAEALGASLAELQAATMWLMQNGFANPNNAGAGAVPYMHLMGIVTLGLMWLRMGVAAQRQLDAGEGDKAFLDGKLVTARFYFDRIAPRALGLRKEIEGGSEAMMALPPEAFVRAA
jgi:hypothetical protein